jgi:outer membrane protein assembly factor BamB
MNRTPAPVCALALAAGLVAGARDAGAVEPSYNWPQWRGPAGQAISTDSRVPLEWSATENVLWKTPIPGRGHSQPIVWGNRVFLTTAIEGDVVPGAAAVKHMDEGKEFLHPDAVGADKKHTFKVLALDADSGKLLWERTAWEGTPYDDRHKKSSYAAPTPVTDGRLVYAYFGAEGLYAYDFDGKLAWTAVPGKIATLGLAVGTSPLLHGDLVILQCDEDNGQNSFVVAYDKKTGKEAWRVARPVQVSWSTPVIVEAREPARAELVTTGSEWVIAYDPATGKELWRTKGVASNVIPSAVTAPDLVIVSAGYPEKVAMAIRPGGSGDLTGTSRILWKYTKGTAYVPSPILVGDYVYLVTDKGLVTCLDARTGEVKYEGGRVPVPATFTASPVAVDGRLVWVSEDGDAYVIKPGPVHEVVRTNPLGEAVYASPAIAQGRLFLRGAQHLYCIGKKPAA